ncbi:MAG: ATP-dependent helicase [Ruminococcaceae bacterium]|nr:ATP-dependent helicase [Oscillospiraceae bacterium]
MSISHIFLFAKKYLCVDLGVRRIYNSWHKIIYISDFAARILCKFKEYGLFYGGFMSYKLDNTQLEIAMHTNGAALTLAGPGSGKTTVLTERTVRLARKIQKPEKILCVTFTNAAGREMENRYKKAQEHSELYGRNIPMFKTVHSFCNEIIREYEKIAGVEYKRIEGASNYKKSIITEIYKEINGYIPESGIIELLCGQSASDDTMLEIKNFRKIMQRYRSYKKEQALIDFDDMILFAREILESKEQIKLNIKEKFITRFEYVQVDEAQDLTKEQFEIMEIIAANGNIFVVADDDQSIYGFRGAAPECLFAFKEKFPDCKVYYLERNYRSVKNIVDCSCRFIAQNKERFEKNLYSETEMGAKPGIICLKNSVEQGEYIFKEANKLIEEDNNIKIGVLYRNNISGLLPRTVLVCNEKEFVSQGEFFKTCEIDFLNVVISKMRKKERNSVFVPSPYKMLRMLKEAGLDKDLENYCRETRKNEYYRQIVSEFIVYICKKADSVEELVTMLDKIDNKRNVNEKECNINFSTVHSSKGLEYDAVFIADVVAGEFPGRKATHGKALEEERRLFYVSLTRAKRYLYVLYPENKREESMFISEFRRIAEGK